MNAVESELRAAWEEPFTLLHLPTSPADSAFTSLVTQYSQPSRVYHNLGHIAHLLETVTPFRDHLAVPDFAALLLAIWFHDAVYDTKASDNEAQSAVLAVQVLQSLSVPEQVLVTVERLILATKTHQAVDDDRVCQILLDTDLSILGSSSSEYDQYAQAIRQEYGWVPDDQYRSGRTQVLQHFLRRPRIYWMEPMFLSRERKARENMEREIMRLAHP
ncbi:MAG: hypothetical protein M3Y13_02040 [Armatimonadota bacterium]|nr:hypothetical protein [Armatimonadota bacterium]